MASIHSYKMTSWRWERRGSHTRDSGRLWEERMWRPFKSVSRWDRHRAVRTPLPWQEDSLRWKQFVQCNIDRLIDGFYLPSADTLQTQ